MTLTFLGQRYEASTTELAPTPSPLMGKYRGVPVPLSTQRAATRAPQTLTYRGIAYTR